VKDTVTQNSSPQNHWRKNTWWSIKLRFYVPPDTRQVISGTFFPANLLA